MKSSELVMKHNDFFRKHPVFTAKDLADHLLSLGEVGARTQEALLTYHRSTGRIILVRRGLYAVIPPGGDPDTYPVSPFLVASKLKPDAVVSYHTALELHGNAYSFHSLITYSATHPLGLLAFRMHVYRGIKFNKALRQLGKEHFGVSTMRLSGQELKVTSRERTMVDMLDRPELSGSWEEIWRSLESVRIYNLDKIVEYVLLLGNATTGAKVGFFLETHREDYMVEDYHLNELHGIRPKQPHYLSRSRRETGRLVSRWNLVVPQYVLEQSWGEVL